MATRRKREKLDAIDWQLLAELQRDARQSDTALARKIGLSRPAVTERIARLETQGVIGGYSAQVDHTRVGWDVEAFVQLRSRGGSYEEAVACVLKMPEVIECQRVTGQNFLLLRVRAASNRHIQKLLYSLTRLGDTETMIVLSTALARRVVEVPPDQEPASRPRRA